MPDSQADFIKRLASDRLKRVDLLLKQGNIDDAIAEIAQIRELDPGNAYARAYQERILELKSNLGRKTPTESPAPAVQPSLPKREPETLPVRPPSPPPTPAVHEPAAAPARAAAPPAPPKKRGKGLILLLDDNVELLAGMAELLQDDGYSVAPYSMAEDALAYLAANEPDLVICDVNLETSEYGGFTFYEKMREIERLHDVPFLFLSGLKDNKMVLAGKELGADDYLTKPVEPETLQAVVRGKIKRYRQIRRKRN